MNADKEPPSFVDTNVLVYAVTPDDWRYDAALKLVHHLLSVKAFRTSTQVLQEFFSVVTKKLKTKLPEGYALRFMDLCAKSPVVLIDYPTLREAVQVIYDRQLSLWDSLIVMAAKRCGAKRLYTEDLNDGQMIEGVEIVNPFR
jgi:predicted nucleic acid-binding protein